MDQIVPFVPIYLVGDAYFASEACQFWCQDMDELGGMLCLNHCLPSYLYPCLVLLQWAELLLLCAPFLLRTQMPGFHSFPELPTR